MRRVLIVEDDPDLRELLRIHALLKRTAEPTAVAISPVRIAHREQLRVWEGFASNHMSRAEWREAREISRAILARFEDDLSPEELARMHRQIDDCDRAL